jgi:hypothetical protein
VFTPGVNEGVNFTPNGQITPLGAKFTPRGEIHPWWAGVKLRMALWVRIQKSVVTNDPATFSVTNCAGLPNYFSKRFILQYK